MLWPLCSAASSILGFDSQTKDDSFHKPWLTGFTGFRIWSSFCLIALQGVDVLGAIRFSGEYIVNSQKVVRET
jgi:hypothetical protein